MASERSEMTSACEDACVGVEDAFAGNRKKGSCSMILWGSIVNAAAIIAGSLLGLILPKMSEQFKRTVTQGIGIALCVLGIMMAMKTTNYLWMLISLVAGSILGEWIQVERRFEQAGQWLERLVPNRKESSVGKGFVTAALVFCIGAMAILGAVDSGVRHNHDILYAKSLMDGLLALIFASTLGIGVMFSAVPVFAYQGFIALAAAAAASLLSLEQVQFLTVEVSAVGGLLIIGIGINMLELTKINVANMLPSVVIMGIIMAV
ncbi:DUF554 domain-containing protein [Paenibacillus abyssi]|uniref:Membrane protein n=1 Tax=Paenibacillus abyssi TaxID=1340531 RepID=A0A917D2I9_9BACL|nr:membrane protein [Paenibacillus abyssi]